MCLLWVIPTRDLLPLLRRNPGLYHKAVQQAVPSVSFDYLAINPIGVSHPPESPLLHSSYALGMLPRPGPHLQS
jgi:hypothetical protein